ncbi:MULTISPECIES: ABC transporter permease subunit [unclassified Leptolyngbya]|uniref:ABC transporter permease n=1 Tax=unclassified Leptolyngbya TaxID=2650499 RepID=UPI0016855571|nr:MULTISPECIES: ABC transporter permease subunit [unclassified Leptolyngbya]MBD1913792.1 ABC transporter permease subunit [Leptolyngbya sp. FACHB-8]MBD2153608.1 ABC transporter permease subunit [Leptolyngbya sp. FACHB-16]
MAVPAMIPIFRQPQENHWLSALLQRSQPYLLLLPALSIIGVLFGGGLILALLQSLGFFTLLGPGELSLDAYQAAFSNSEFWQSLLQSFYIAIVATALSTLLSIALALLLRSAGRWATLACQITLPIPHLVGVVGILLLLAPSGLLARIFLGLGWIQSDQDFPLLVNDGASMGVLIHFLWKEIPFITLILLAVLRGLNPAYEQQARALGATPWQCFWNITLPLMKPGILSASLIVFGFIFSSFEVPFLLGAIQSRTLPVYVYRAFTDTDLARRPEAIALGLTLSAISIAVIALYLWVTTASRAAIAPKLPNR